jgi:hypothetical protein
VTPWKRVLQVWPQPHHQGAGAPGAQPQRGPHTPPDMEVTTVKISYENMQVLTREAVAVARQHHVDSCLQVRMHASLPTGSSASRSWGFNIHVMVAPHVMVGF